ncbi:MarR family transcriptional regulator [Arthrobacter sp. StoSoilB5]|jgi:DNA-binding MarR family transcriptional regulator|uniref:MarR family winged helix-turn-helix transcriptional regulator n=1 Tax=Arthrobacter sp. StoSoilB5 TaxID=2830992 RepID=UPI001CC4B2F5|nr:MarR family transcriptional regulator [Arthrobacter sp. StoSoilB5]
MPEDPQSTANDRTRRVRELLTELSQGLSDQVRSAVAELDLTTTQAAVLRQLATPHTQREIANSLQCDPSNITYVVDKLEKAGLVTREQHPSDRRAKILRLTESGLKTRKTMIDRFEAKSPLRSLSEDDLQRLEELLAKTVRPGI